MERRRQDITDLFVKDRKLTLAVKLVGTFAFTYYLLYFILLTIFGYYYRSVYAPTNPEETLFHTMLMSAILWAIVAMLVISLILLFRGRRYGKFLFMFFTVVLLIYQIIMTENHVWSIYVIEIMMMLVMAPLKVFVNINKKIKEEVINIVNVEDKN